ncbi:hypothetical protein [Ancylobacter pratisalsi]|uniref:Uncharacterized protein n=1 Tax=Ancylobacter pratisalsi TaxID=1745854 RepID=A0A6P1YSY1_9HYPH|nr:hypothetical protein [Ancylobacter pratisalsi]QIB35806.1 hypothetical protein G3A50_20390 [Ancylobacter pratisalsi]
MTLDVFAGSTAADIAFARQHLAQDLPATFSESFEAAWRAGIEFGNSDAQSRARMEGVQEFVDRIRQRSGVTLVNPALNGGAAALEQMNAQIAQLAPKFPDLGLKPLTDADLDEMGLARSRAAREAQQRMAGREQTWGSTAGNVLGSVAAGALDPVNLITVPLAAPMSLGILGTALATAGITGGTQLGIEAITSAYKERVAPGYGASGEPLKNIGHAALAGGVLGGGAKALGAVWTRVQTGAWPRSIRDAGNVVASEGQVGDTNVLPGIEGEVAHRTALQTAIDALVTGRPVDVSETVTPNLLRGYEARLAPVMEARAAARGAQESVAAIEREGARLPGTVERLSEVQLADIRATAQAARDELGATRQSLDTDATSLTARRAALTGRDTEVQALREEVDGLRADLERSRARLAEARPPTDPETQARLDAIEGDLTAASLPAERRVALESERLTILDTIAATAPVDARLAGSLRQEIKALERALRSRENALDTAGRRLSRERAKLDRADAELPARRTAAETRAASREASAGTELRRAVSRLAQEGYGIRLARDDAQAIADRIMTAAPDEVDARLRELTELLVDRRLEAQRAQPIAEPSPGRANPVGEQRARVAYHVEETRKRVQSLAREVGYEMPKDDAAAIAAAIVRASTDDEAGAILDELLLRPRTMAATLPGTEAARLEGSLRAGGRTESPGGLQAGSHSSPASQAGSTVAGEPRHEQIAALSDELTPAKIAAARAASTTDDVVANDFDKLRMMGDRQVPVGERLNERGELEPVMRSVDDLLDEAEARLAAAREISACAMPKPEMP